MAIYSAVGSASPVKMFLLPRRLVYEYELPVDTAVMVNEVYKGSPGEQAGLISGDIILAFGTNSIAGIDELHRLLTADVANRQMPLIVLRGTERRYLSIVSLSKEN
jgi:S1-C subfamily serine protease